MHIRTGNVTLRCGVKRCRNTFVYPRAMEASRVRAVREQSGWAQGAQVRAFDFYCPAHAHHTTREDGR